MFTTTGLLELKERLARVERAMLSISVLAASSSTVFEAIRERIDVLEAHKEALRRRKEALGIVLLEGAGGQKVDQLAPRR